MKRIALLLPALLIGVGVLLLAGCLYIPWTDKVPPGQRDVRNYVGDAKSDRPLRVGVATRKDVLRIAGYPNGGGGDTWIYEWSAQNGGWFQPLCFRVDPAWRDYTLTLQFGDDGRVKGFKVNHRVQEFPLFDGGGPRPPQYIDPANPTQPTTRQIP